MALTNKVAKKLADFIQTLIADQSITDTSRIHVFLDDLDITKKSVEYTTLINEAKYDEAFAVPDIPEPFAFPMLQYLWRLGVKVDIYTTRVDTKRVEATGNSIMEKYQVPGLFNSYICLRNEENKVLPLADVITETSMPKDGRNIAILYCNFQNRLDDFAAAELQEYCAVVRSLVMDI